MLFETKRSPAPPLYDPAFEHDACGIGAIINIKGSPSHSLVERTLHIVEHLEHRAGKDAEGKTGDGVGILLQISHKFFVKAAAQVGISLGDARTYGVGMFFLPQDGLLRRQRMKMFELMVKQEGLELLGWREVPVHPEIIGARAAASMPAIYQAFIAKPHDCAKGLEFDRRLYVVRRVFEQASSDDSYVVSLSSRTIVYKGMLLVTELRSFYDDLRDPDYESAIAMTHSRFSTNTNPSWERAHPYRLLVHNGEINTIRGNADKMALREESMTSPAMESELYKVRPVIDPRGSDSAMLDNTLEFLMMNGMELPQAVMTLIPEPWSHERDLSPAKHDFYQYHAILMEPWDGPASILFSDGDVVGAVLDRNGLRPSRYCITDEDELILASEVGVAEIEESHILRKDRLRPGKMLLIDTRAGRLIDDEELKDGYAARHPYGEWLDRQMLRLSELPAPNRASQQYSVQNRARIKKAFGYHYEDYRSSICVMAQTGAEPITSMGCDTPLPVLSDRPRPLFDYFKQLFAQVTNPSIDAIREKLVTDTSVYIGAMGNLLVPSEENCNAIQLDTPILTNLELQKLKNLRIRGFKVATQSILYYKGTSLEKALDRLFVEVDKHCKDGANIIILTDRGVDEYHVAIPYLLAVSAIHQHLVRTKQGGTVALVLESGEPREVHHFAALLGYGACAINPYLAHESVLQLIENGLLKKDAGQAIADYNRAVVAGVVKIASKMGISTLQSYQGSKMFEAVGIASDVVEKYFTGTLSRIGGITLQDLEKQIDALHSKAFDPLGFYVDLTLESPGIHRERGGKEPHRYDPLTISLLQQSTRTGDYALFKQYSAALYPEGATPNLRSLLRVKWAKTPLPLAEVESEEEIVKRFRTGAMSFGSISPEAHECLAVAMNRLGGRSNTGEGGEQRERLTVGTDGIDRCSAIKQVASGRFGVTGEYLLHAKEIQIKMAQGAKPGEGGHLPGGKVYPWVAETRCSTPGVSLISPPPHHDIYSIEDLAQLIYDLKNANRDATISVKLVSEAGVGTVASGVAKAGAGTILISGYDGGSGATPKSSVHNAGLPWEIGLAEAHQTLKHNGLRSRVKLETDGKLMCGYDVLIAALLGADGFGFATAPLVTLGCVMMRVCNLDTCPVGVATQNPELRKNFKGKPEYVENFMRFVARELREYMAKLGIRTVQELVGRTDLLEQTDDARGTAASLDLHAILDAPQLPTMPVAEFDFKLNETPDVRVLLKEFAAGLESGASQALNIEVGNVDRAFGTVFGSEVTRRFGNTLPDDTFTVNCTGFGGQSFGAFVPKGVTLRLVGESNDHLGKGLCGGKLIVRAPEGAAYDPHENILIGNVALYGATSGEVYIAGVAGERFCVRNSGANAVVEGVGNHGCEYMTGGTVVVLGEVGENFAAGMSGGTAYVLDTAGDFYRRVNKDTVTCEPLRETEDIRVLHSMITRHAEYTSSAFAAKILDDFTHYLPMFRKVISEEYRRMQQAIAALTAQGLPLAEAKMRAFAERKA